MTTQTILSTHKQQKGLSFLQSAGAVLLAVVIGIVFSTQSLMAAPGDVTSNIHWRKATPDGPGSIRDMSSIASSSDGTKLIAALAGEMEGVSSYVYISTDSGATWTEQTELGSRLWTSVASNSDGSKLAAADSLGGDFSSDGSIWIYDASVTGAKWTEQTPTGSHSWTSVASSGDGSKLTAVASLISDGTTSIWTYDANATGAKWTEQTPAGSVGMRYVASSSDGSKLAAFEENGFIWTYDANAGSDAKWTKRTAAGSRDWRSISSSSDGDKLAAVVFDGSIWTSENYGADWIEQTDVGTGKWWSITSSSDGSKLAAVSAFEGDMYDQGGFIWMYDANADSDIKWTKQTQVGQSFWTSVTTSSDGTKLAAVAGGGSIYIGTAATATTPANKPLDQHPTLPSRPTFTGTAAPFATVVVTVRSDPITCTTTADAAGNWSCTLPTNIPAGEHTVTILVTNPDSSTQELGPYAITVAAGQPTVVDSNTPKAPNSGLQPQGGVLLHVGSLTIALLLMGGAWATRRKL